MRNPKNANFRKKSNPLFFEKPAFPDGKFWQSQIFFRTPTCLRHFPPIAARPQINFVRPIPIIRSGMASSLQLAMKNGSQESFSRSSPGGVDLKFVRHQTPHNLPCVCVFQQNKKKLVFVSSLGRYITDGANYYRPKRYRDVELVFLIRLRPNNAA